MVSLLLTEGAAPCRARRRARAAARALGLCPSLLSLAPDHDLPRLDEVAPRRSGAGVRGGHFGFSPG